MTRDEIIRMAREAGAFPELSETPEKDIVFLRRFAALVAEREREACAKVCEAMRPSQQEFDQRFFTACTLNANAIRARGQA